MEGPTPVSALIHAATLVTAGVFLIIRCSSLFEATDTSLTVVTLIGSITSFFAATIGLVQNDLKRVIAFSTCSQLGYMVFAIGLSNYSVALFHLANHAVFKALLFLSAGCIIHGLNDEQDLRRFGGVLHLFPISYVMVLIGSLALVGFPFLTGFYSKDVILELAASKHSSTSNLAHTLGCIAAFFTAFYSFRLAFLTFSNKSNSSRIVVLSAHEGSIKLTLPLMILAAGSLVVGYLNKDLVIGLGSLTFQSSIVSLPDNVTIVDSEFLPSIIKNIPLLFTLLGISLSWLITNTNSLLSKEAILQYKIYTVLREVYTYLSKK
jgi:NADH-ubiquinone oxidoreductase chain 5